MGKGVFEQWSEHHRRWFLVTFCAVSWTLFANSLAHLGEHIPRGGVGPDVVHAISVIGATAMWIAVWGAFKLSMRRWVFATLCGITLSSAVIESGLRDGAAAATWSVHCDSGNGPACRQLAEYYEAGRSPVHGWLDAQRLHAMACEYGVSASCVHPNRRTVAVGELPALLRRCTERRVASACREAAAVHDQRGELDLMYGVQDFACAELTDIESCDSLLGSGYHQRRIAACEVLVPHCRTSSAHRCFVTQRRCARVASPHAGSD